MKKSLVGSLPIYAQHLAELTGVRVIINRDGRASTDGKHVYVPFTEEDLPLSFGYVAHECSHVRNTDMQCFAETATAPFRQGVLNILEDIRIEKLSIEQYPGTEGDLSHLVKTVLGSQLSPEDVAKKPPLAIVHDTLLLAGRWMALGQDLEQPARVMLDAQEQLLGSALSAEIMQMACTATRCASTREVLQLADAIIAKLPSEQEEPQGGGNPPPPNQESGQPQDSQEAGAGGEGQQKDEEAGDPAGGKDDQSEQQGSGAGGEGSGDEDDSAQDGQAAGAQGDEQGSEGDEQGSSADSEPKNSAGNQPGGQQEQQSEQEAGSDTADTSAQDAAQGGQGAGSNPPSPQARGLREQAENATAKDLEGLISEVGDKAAEILKKNALAAPRQVIPATLAGRSINCSPFAASRREALGVEQSAGLRQTLMGLLQAQVACRVSLRRQGRRIDTGRIAMLPAGETRVFRQKSRAERHSASIQILFDKSGSMSGQMEQAEAAIYAVLKSLENIPLVTTGAMAFPEYNGSHGLCCALIKSPKESLRDAVRLGGFGAMADYDTPLAEALWPAAVEVLRAKGERKILFVITDGAPNCAIGAKNMVDRCEASGIDVIGLGFGGATQSILSRVFTKYRVVGTVANLKRELYQVVRESLQA